MEMMVRVAAVAVTAAVLSAVLRRHTPELSLLLVLAVLSDGSDFAHYGCYRFINVHSLSSCVFLIRVLTMFWHPHFLQSNTSNIVVFGTLVNASNGASSSVLITS